eukprot:4706809-Pyramimonas_sp.AAC.1
MGVKLNQRLLHHHGQFAPQPSFVKPFFARKDRRPSAFQRARRQAPNECLHAAVWPEVSPGVLEAETVSS